MHAAVLVLAVALVLVGGAWVAPSTVELGASHEDAFVRGVALGLFATDPDWDYGPLVEEIRERGATDVLIVVNAYQSNRFASDVAMRAGYSPSHETVVRTVRQVRAAGLRAAVMPVIRLRERAAHEWRGVIAPADGLDAWFSSYRAFVLPLARIAEQQGAHRFVIGSELSSLERYERRWRRLIEDVRAEFRGRLTYSANWDHVGDVSFWDVLDEVGLTAYFPLSVAGESSEWSVVHAWQAPRRTIEALQRRVGKPVLITEIGYPSRAGASVRPWDDATDAEVDLRAQQRLYRGFCDAFSETSSVAGFYVWNWFGVGGPRDAGFTPRGKPAAAELSRCFARDWGKPELRGSRS